MSRVIDHTKDEGRLVGPLLRSAPDLVPRIKMAADLVGGPRRAGHAWPDAGLFPIHSPQDAALSFLYAGMQSDHVPREVQEKIAQAVIAYDLDARALVGALNDRRGLRTKAASAAPEPDVVADWALPREGRLRIKTAGEVHEAPQALERWKAARVIDLRKMAEASCLIVRRAGQLGMATDALPPLVLKYAGLHACDSDTLADAAYRRAMLAPSPDTRAIYEKVASAAHAGGQRNKTVYDRAALTKIASHLETLDRCTGLDRLWGEDIPDPVASVFNTEKLAVGTVSLGTGTASLLKMARIPLETYGDILGDEFMEEINDGQGNADMEKLSAIVPTLPLDMRRMLDTHIGSLIRP